MRVNRHGIILHYLIYKLSGNNAFYRLNRRFQDMMNLNNRSGIVQVANTS